MRFKALLVGAGLLGLLLVGCAAPVIPGAEVTEDGCYVFKAVGTSVVAKEDDPLSLVEAQVAACTMARANLLELVKGAMIESDVSVGDLMFKSQEARVSVAGFLGRAKVELVQAEPSRLPQPMIVTAVATLTLTEDEIANLEKYVE